MIDIEAIDATKRITAGLRKLIQKEVEGYPEVKIVGVLEDLELGILDFSLILEQELSELSEKI